MTDIALTMILKNEEKTIEKSINSALPVVNEIVLGLDSESRDDTRNKIKQYKTIPITLDNDLNAGLSGFATARNRVLDEVRSSWVLAMDGHEVFDCPDKNAFLNTVKQADLEGFDSIECKSWINPVNGIPAIINSRTHVFKKNVRFRGEIHEVPFCKKTLRTNCFKIIRIKNEQAAESYRERINQSRTVYVNMLKKTLETNPNDTRSLFYLGNTYRDYSQYPEAIEQYTKYLETGRGWDEEIYHTLYNLGLCYWKIGNNKTAIKFAIQATKQMPQMAEAFFLLGKIYYFNKQYRQARLWFERCCSLEIPDVRLFVYPRIYMIYRYDYLAMTYHFLGLIDLAIENVKKALVADPEDGRLQNNFISWEKTIKKIT